MLHYGGITNGLLEYRYGCLLSERCIKNQKIIVRTNSAKFHKRNCFGFISTRAYSHRFIVQDSSSPSHGYKAYM